MRLSVTLTAAAAPVITQLNCVRFDRPMPIETTMNPANETAANASGPTTREALENSGSVSQSTSHGESSASAVATQVERTTRYVRTHAYVRFASSSLLIEKAKAGQAVRNAVRSSTIADATRTPTE